MLEAYMQRSISTAHTFRILFFLLQAKELQTLHNLRKLFVQDLATRVKKVNHVLTYQLLIVWYKLLFLLSGNFILKIKKSQKRG